MNAVSRRSALKAGLAGAALAAPAVASAQRPLTVALSGSRSAGAWCRYRPLPSGLPGTT